MPRGALWREVYDSLKRRILTLELAPGTKISESGLAREFDLSPTPARDALGRLCQEGLVVTRPERGYWVAPLDIYDLQQLATFRFILERGVAELLLENVPDLTDLRVLNSTLDDPHLDIDGILDLNIKFHLGLANLTENIRLAGSVRRVIEDSTRYFRVGASQYPATQMAADHSRLLDAIEQRDLAAAVQFFHREAYGTRDRVAQILVNGQRALTGNVTISLPHFRPTADQ